LDSNNLQEFLSNKFNENQFFNFARHITKNFKETDETLYKVEDERFAQDIQSRKPYQDAIKRIKKKLKNAKSQEEIDYILKNEADFPANYSFGGPQTAANDQYGSLEWDLGSYRTNIHVDDYNPETGEVKVSFVTTNEFHLSSLTRINGEGQTKITDALNRYVNEPINNTTEWIDETLGTDLFSSDVNITSPKSLLPDLENGEEYYGIYGGAILGELMVKDKRK
jgi:hypothetical protein